MEKYPNILEVEGAANSNEEITASKPALTSLLRRYVGTTAQHPKTQIVVKPSYNHFFISRYYTDHSNAKIKMSWRFNEEGRLDLIDCKTIWRGSRNNPAEQISNIITVFNFQNRKDKDWSNSRALYHIISKDVDVINQSFRFHSLQSKYNSLARFGHGIAKEIWCAIRNKSLLGLFFVKEGDKSLTEIINDNEAKYMLERTTRVLPCISFDDSSEFGGYLGDMIIDYRKDNFYPR